MMVYAFNPSTQKVKAGKPGIYSETMAKPTNQPLKNPTSELKRHSGCHVVGTLAHRTLAWLWLPELGTLFYPVNPHKEPTNGTYSKGIW